jgi:hypothetical protein
MTTWLLPTTATAHAQPSDPIAPFASNFKPVLCNQASYQQPRTSMVQRSTRPMQTGSTVGGTFLKLFSDLWAHPCLTDGGTPLEYQQLFVRGPHMHEAPAGIRIQRRRKYVVEVRIMRIIDSVSILLSVYLLVSTPFTVL